MWKAWLLGVLVLAAPLGCSCPGSGVAPSYRDNDTTVRDRHGNVFADKSIVSESEYKTGIQAGGY